MSDIIMPSVNLSKPLPNLNGKTRDIQKIEEAAKEFESVFIAEMLRPMFETVETNELFGGGNGEDTWKGMLVDEYGKGIAKAGGIGLADHITAAMIQMQEMRGN